jgi:hypothetical protein
MISVANSIYVQRLWSRMYIHIPQGIKCYHLRATPCEAPTAETEFCRIGVEDVLGVDGSLWSRRLRFQKPALGPSMMNASVQRERPLRDSG